jgi:hypothetical protein
VKGLGEAEKRAMEQYMKGGGAVTKITPPAAKQGLVVPPKTVAPKALLSAPAKKTGRAPTTKEALETMPESESWLPDPKAFRKGVIPNAAITRPKSVVSKPAEQPTMDLSAPEPRVAKKAAARQARKAEKSEIPPEMEAIVKEANKQKMRELLAAKKKRGVGSY